jgi:hypothetical protein
MADSDVDRESVPDPSEGPGADERLVEWAQAVADRRAIDWERVRTFAPELAESITALRLVETVITAHRSRETVAGESREDAPPRPAFAPLPPDASWGPLRLIEKIGEGRFGEVYRAFEPALQIEVALKILRRGAPDEAAAERFFDEARRLARVRHPSVLRVYGAAIHDGKVGIWSELVRGRTLEDSILADGPFGPREAAIIGTELCGAVAAVHRAGLLHRDLKTQNVMREQGGRVVLMDFGSVSELAGSPPPGGAGYGTPITVAPELLRGESATPATDVYGLGVLLYRLVAGRYPVEATSLVELIDKHHRGESMSLREARPDLPLDFVQVVERAIDAEPKRRYPGPGALERALKATLGAAGVVEEGAGAGSGAVPEWLKPAGIGFAALLAIAAGLFAADLFLRSGQPGPTPERTAPPAKAPMEAGVVPPGNATNVGADLMATARLYRQRGGAIEPLSAGASVAPGDGLYLEIQSGEPMHVYVLDEDEAGRVFVLFPLADFRPGNPLAGGVRHRLPGIHGGRIENWRVTSGSGTEDLIVLGSRESLSELERDLRDLPHAIPGAPVSYGRLSSESLERLRGIGGTVPETSPTPAGTPSRRLSEILSGVEANAPRPSGLWFWHITLRGQS